MVNTIMNAVTGWWSELHQALCYRHERIDIRHANQADGDGLTACMLLAVMLVLLNNRRVQTGSNPSTPSLLPPGNHNGQQFRLTQRRKLFQLVDTLRDKAGVLIQEHRRFIDLCTDSAMLIEPSAANVQRCSWFGTGSLILTSAGAIGVKQRLYQRRRGVADESNTRVPSIPAQLTKRQRAGKSVISKSSGSSNTRSAVSRRNIGAICRPPRTPSVAGIR